MLVKTRFRYFFSVLFSPMLLAEETSNNLVWLAINQNSYDFLSDGNSEFKPETKSVGFSRQLSSEWSASINYSESKNKKLWLQTQIVDREANSGAQVDSSSKGVSVTWLPDEFGLTLSYNDVNSLENSVTQTPTTFSSLNSQDSGSNISYFGSAYFDKLIVSWTLGLQYLKSDITSVDIINTEPVTNIKSQLKQKSWSSFVDLDFTYWLENDSFSWAPQFILSWNIEISNDEEFKSAIFRNSERLVFTQLNNRLSDNLREPDSGTWEAAIIFDWNANFGSSIVYGKSIGADVEIESISFDISYSF